MTKYASILRNMGMRVSDTCMQYGFEAESHKHLFFACGVSLVLLQDLKILARHC